MQEEPKREKTPRELQREEHDRLTLVRANAERALTAEYLKIAKTPAFQDLLSKVKSFSELHVRVAKDGVGRREQQIVKLNPEERVSELDKAAGIEEILDYLERKTTVSVTNNKGKNDE